MASDETSKQTAPSQAEIIPVRHKPKRSWFNPLQAKALLSSVTAPPDLKLQKANDELQMIFDNVTSMIWLKDEFNRILRLNVRAAESMGGTVQEFEGCNTYDLFAESARKYHEDDLEVIRSGQPKIGIIEQFTPSRGGRRWVRVDKIPYTDPTTGTQCIFVIATDITNLRQAEIISKQLKELALDVANASSLEDTISHILQRLCDFIGWDIGHAYIYDPAEKAMRSTGFWHVRESYAFAPFIEATEKKTVKIGLDIAGFAYREKELAFFEDINDHASFMRRESAALCGLHSGFALPVVVGDQVACVLEFFTRLRISQEETYRQTQGLDEYITMVGVYLGRAIELRQVEKERRKTEDALRLSEERLNLAVTSSADGLWDYNVLTGHIYYSPSFMKQLGYEFEELPSNFETFEFLLHPDDKEATYKAVADAHSGKEPYNTDYRLRHKDGDYIWCNARGNTVINEMGVATRMLGFTTAIQRRKEAEETLKNLTQRLLESNTELERFAYIASHDMQEPLRMISSFSEILSRDYESKLDEEGKEYLGIVTDSAKRMQQMVEDLLAYARIGNEANPNTLFSAKNRVENACTNLSVALNENNAEVRVSELPELYGNPIQFMRLMQNLIGNGVKYQRKDALPRIDIHCERQYDKWLFCVKDNGIGMAAEYTEKIFEPFRRLHTWKQYSGSGIGLSVCKRIVEHHGGTIWAESKPQQGSSFFFTWPVISAPENSNIT